MKKQHASEARYKSCKVVGQTVDEQGVIKAYVAIFGNVDLGGDILEPGAFAESISKKLPKIIWHHDWEQPIGTTLMAKEVMPGDPSLPESIRENGGLYVEGQLVAGVQKADEARLLLKAGAIDEFSFGYWVDDGFLDKEGNFHLKKVEIFEWSPVLVGMNPKTVLVEAKAKKDGEPKDGEGQEGEGTTTDEEGATIAEDKVIEALSTNEKTIRRAIKALTDALNALTEADTQVGTKVEHSAETRAATKKVSVTLINRALKELLAVKRKQ